MLWDAGRSKSAEETGLRLLKRSVEAELGRRLEDTDPPKRTEESRNCCDRRCAFETSGMSVSARCSMASTTGSFFFAPSMEMLTGREREKFRECVRECMRLAFGATIEAGRPSTEDDVGAGLVAIVCACANNGSGVMEMEPAREWPRP